MSSVIRISSSDDLSEEERRALRRSRFCPLPPVSSAPQTYKPKLAHPGGPLATNKAVALAKFLQRKLQEPGGSSSLNPELVEKAVENAKDALHSSDDSDTVKNIRHVISFSDGTEEASDMPIDFGPNVKVKQNKKKKLKNKKRKAL